MIEKQNSSPSPQTVAAQALGWIDEATRAVVPPLHLSTTFERAPDNTFPSGRSYARTDNPAFDQPEALLARLEHRAGARVAVDSTVATPVFTRPLELGADLVMHSATKYLNGHSDVVAGALVTKADDEHWRKLKALRVQLGGIPGSFECYLL